MDQSAPIDTTQPATLFLWPYEDWSQVLKDQPQPLRVKVTAGPLAKGDLDPQPHVGYLNVQLEPLDWRSRAARSAI